MLNGNELDELEGLGCSGDKTCQEADSDAIPSWKTALRHLSRPVMSRSLSCPGEGDKDPCDAWVPKSRF